jgi:hypothetical protein
MNRTSLSCPRTILDVNGMIRPIVSPRYCTTPTGQQTCKTYSADTSGREVKNRMRLYVNALNLIFSTQAPASYF